MAQGLLDYEQRPEQTTGGRQRKRVDRSTAQALAAALSALAIASLVVGASTSALEESGTAGSSDVRTGTITLADDDGGRSLFDLRAMAPGRQVTECINVTYTGDVLPVDLFLVVESVGDIADYVEIDIERGAAGGFGACDGFELEDVVFEGRLDELVDERTSVGGFLNEEESSTFRITFDLADESAAAGRSGTVDFMWEAVPA